MGLILAAVAIIAAVIWLLLRKPVKPEGAWEIDGKFYTPRVVGYPAMNARIREQASKVWTSFLGELEQKQEDNARLIAWLEKDLGIA